MIYFSYLWSVLRHKWFVLLAGLRVGGIPFWRLLVHDWQKFSKWEYGAYARKTAAGFRTERSEVEEMEFAYAWLHHENTAPHHWGYWIPRSGKNAQAPLPMPETYIKEMVADWMGAGRAYTGDWDMSKWLDKSLEGIGKNMHTSSRTLVYQALGKQGYFYDEFKGWVYVGRP